MQIMLDIMQILLNPRAAIAGLTTATNERIDRMGKFGYDGGKRRTEKAFFPRGTGKKLPEENEKEKNGKRGKGKWKHDGLTSR